MSDFYLNVGYSIQLLGQSAYHKAFQSIDYFETEFLPPLWLGQCYFGLRDDGEPTSVATWAWLSTPVLSEVTKSGRALEANEWNCGKHLFFNDWIAIHGQVRPLLNILTCRVFPDHIATSIRRNSDGTVRRINRWTGSNVRSQHKI